MSLGEIAGLFGSFAVSIFLIVILARSNQKNDPPQERTVNESDQTLYSSLRVEPWIPTPRFSPEAASTGGSSYRQRDAGHA